MTKHERVASVEEAVKPRPVNVFVYCSEDKKFPLDIGESPARLWAWLEVENAYHDRGAGEAERTYDRALYSDFKYVRFCWKLCDDSLLPGMFKADLDAGKFTKADYLREYAEAVAYSGRAGLPRPTNYLEAKP
jgi:hypothetical protein